MKVDQIMTEDVACCVRTDTAQQAANLMKDKNVGLIPVLESDQSYKVAGVVTDRDLCNQIIASGKDATVTTLEECMSTDLVTCSADDDVETVVELMQSKQLRRIPVVDKEGRIEGIVATADLVLSSDQTPEVIDQTFKKISCDQEVDKECCSETKGSPKAANSDDQGEAPHWVLP